MNRDATLRRFLSAPIPAAAAYLGAMLLLLYVVASSVSSFMGKRADVAALRTMLGQFDGRKVAAHGQGTGITGPAGSPFLEGATVTIASAALLKRVTAAVTRLGGSVLSSQVDLHGDQSKAGFVTVIASCDIDQPGLQQLLYDLEAGMPFLFVDQLLVQAPTSFAASGNGKLRILLSVSGQWQGAR